MITQFAFTPTVTTEEMRLNPDIYEKVRNINKIRAKKVKNYKPKAKKH